MSWGYFYGNNIIIDLSSYHMKQWHFITCRTNKTLYGSVPLSSLTDGGTTAVSELPSSSGGDPVSQDRLEDETVTETSTQEDTESLGCGLVTLSNLPKAQWFGLSSLDIIKVGGWS